MEILRGTPSWVYLVFFIIMYYGVMACFAHKETKKSLSTTVMVFTVWSIYSLYSNGEYVYSIATFMAGCCVGYVGVIKLKLLSIEKVSMGEYQDSLSISGSPLMLVIYLVVFIANFFVGYEKAVMPVVNVNYIYGMHLLSGIVFAVIITRAKILKRKLSENNETELTQGEKP